jgi:phosphoglucomutase
VKLVELFCEVDGNFPNHHPDPSKPENLQDLIRALRSTEAELGLAFDGDGDRLGVVTKDGEIIYPGSPADALCRRRPAPLSRPADHLRRQMHASAGALDPCSTAASR